MKITSPKLETAHVSPNEKAVQRCQRALELKDRGDYEGAQEVMRPIWKRGDHAPNIKGLHPSVAAAVLLCVGILTRWIGSKNEVNEAQESAKNLISESITLFESQGDLKKIAEARSELAYCYWREGALDEARILFNEALLRLTMEGNARATALLGLAVVEWSASRCSDALKILNENASLFKKISNYTIKGTYHSQLAIILRSLATSEFRDDYFQQAIIEYQKADDHFRLAHNTIFRADVKNNLGFLLYKL